MKRIKTVIRFTLQVWRSFWGRPTTKFLFALLLLCIILIYFQVLDIEESHWLQASFLGIGVWLAIILFLTLTDIYSLKRKEAAITLCQLSILVLIGILISGIYIIFDLKDETINKAIYGGMGALLAWIFQDTIKGVVAFIHLRLNNQLQIGDWIQVPNQGVDGEVKRVTLTTVTIYNWDTTTSSIPTSMLHSNHFINSQNMMEGKTYGRRMYMTFVLDTGWFHAFTEKEKEEIEKTGDILDYLSKDEIVKSKSNAQLFRLYLYHWLMNHPHISQQPRLIVSWQEQKEHGMPLQVYAFIIDSSLPSFEWQQSQIVEHIIESLDWFGLRLYQSPSAYDASNSNVYLSDKPATYRKEE